VSAKHLNTHNSSTIEVKSRFFQFTVSAVVLVFSLFLLSLAWPRFLSSLRFIPVDIAIDQYYQTGEIPTERLQELIGTANESLDTHKHYRFFDGLSILQLLRAVDWETPAAERRGAYEAAQQAAILSLKAAPGRTSTWTRLAYVSWILHEEPEDILAYWKMSVFTGRTDHSQFQQRLEIGLAHYSLLDEEGVAMLRDQLLLAWRVQPGVLVPVLKNYDSEFSITRALIENTDPVALQDMESWLEKLD